MLLFFSNQPIWPAALDFPKLTTSLVSTHFILLICIYFFVFVTLFHFPTVYIDCHPKPLLRRPSKKVETYVQGCVPIYLNTILSYASFFSDSDHLTCSLIQSGTACPTARSPNMCYSPGLNTHVIQITHNNFVSYTIMHP